jgi:hypothetical protein
MKPVAALRNVSIHVSKSPFFEPEASRALAACLAASMSIARGIQSLFDGGCGKVSGLMLSQKALPIEEQRAQNLSYQQEGGTLKGVAAHHATAASAIGSVQLRSVQLRLTRQGQGRMFCANLKLKPEVPGEVFSSPEDLAYARPQSPAVWQSGLNAGAGCIIQITAVLVTQFPLQFIVKHQSSAERAAIFPVTSTGVRASND